MTRINSLSEDKQQDALRDATERGLHVVLSIKRERRWLTFKTRFLASSDVQDGLVLAYPTGGPGGQMPELTEGEEIGLSFRRGHKKCLFGTKVVRRTTVRLEEGVSVPAIVVDQPGQIHQLQRRAYNRAEVPESLTIEVTLWEGGLTGEAAGPRDSTPTFSGDLTDISAGGLSVRLSSENDPLLKIGDTVGCRFRPDPDAPPISLDANFRYVEEAGAGHIRLGFQIVGLEATREGAAVLHLLSEFVKRLGQVRGEGYRRRTRRGS